MTPLETSSYHCKVCSAIPRETHKVSNGVTIFPTHPCPSGGGDFHPSILPIHSPLTNCFLAISNKVVLIFPQLVAVL
jgi:hypothetical protein